MMSLKTTNLMAVRRLSALGKHISPVNCAAELPSAAWTLSELRIGDKPEAWSKAGFLVSQSLDQAQSAEIQLSNLLVRLSANEKKPLKFVFETTNKEGIEKQILCEGVQLETKIVEDIHFPVSVPKHSNTCIDMAEVVIYLKNVNTFVKALQDLGIHVKSPPKKIGENCMSAVYFGGLNGSQRIRLLMCGPVDPNKALEQTSSNWMFGSGERPAEITGWLPVARNLDVLKKHVGTGEIKDAIQSGRKITTLKRGTVHGLSGTFAFLSDGIGSAI